MCIFNIIEFPVIQVINRSQIGSDFDLILILVSEYHSQVFKVPFRCLLDVKVFIFSLETSLNCTLTS